MQTCPLCGLGLEDSYLYCPEDGSILKSPEPVAPADDLPEEASEPPARPVVLYCPACASEYPLTFSECPVHGVPLTKHRLPTFIKPPAQVIQNRQEASVVDRTAQLHQEANAVASHGAFIASNPGERQSYSPPVVDADIEDDASGYDTAPLSEVKSEANHKSFRVAAAIVVVGLAILSLAGLYTFYVNATRKPASQTAKSANKPLVATQESAFIPTPDEARDYKEEPAKPSGIVVPAANENVQTEKGPNSVAAPAKHADQKFEDRNLPAVAKREPAAMPQAAATQAAPTQVAPPQRRQTSATDLVLPRGTYGLVDARLIRMRARQTASGIRYDLTFNLEEQAGRTTQYERLAVATHSASGVNHSEAMPFYHRLGAAGSLTFTISVEMRGRRESDWQGRIICTGIGTDNQGRPLRTSFGANVSP